MADAAAVVKVGGSLFDLPDLGPRLRAWLDTLGACPVLLVPGGGAAADVVRDLDRRHRLGEEASHWLALQALSLTGRFLQALLPGAPLVHDLHRGALAGRRAVHSILDPLPFAQADEGLPGCLPHCWDVTSDAVAARAAVVAGAGKLVLLKSATIAADLGWEEAGRRGFVDRMLAEVLRRAPSLRASAVNFRAWRPGPPAAGPARGLGRP